MDFIWKLINAIYALTDKVENIVELLSDAITYDGNDAREVKKLLLSSYVRLHETREAVGKITTMLNDERWRLENVSRCTGTKEEWAMLLNGVMVNNKIEAIKMVRKLQPHLGLKEAKDIVEAVPLQRTLVVEDHS